MSFFRRYGGVLLGLSGILLGAFYLYETTRIKMPRLGDLLGPQFFPYILGVLFLICSALLMVLEARKVADRPRSYPALPRPLVLNFLGTWALLIAYVWVVDAVGFVITAFLFVFLFLTLTRHATIGSRIAWSAFLVAAFFLVFKVWLAIPLPPGVLAAFGG